MSPGVSIIPTSNRNMEQEFITYPVSPTTHLLLKDNEDYHRKLESLEGQSFLNNNVIYGALEESLVKDDPKMKDLLLGELKEYNKHRHLSRFSKRRRLEERRLDVDSFQVEPLLQGLGTHYITAWVGTPPQRTTVIVDTGSRFTVFPCKGCEQCGEEYHTDQYFDQDKSSTFKVSKCMECNDDGFYCSEDQCHFGVAYAEGSEWDAYLVSDKFFLGGNGNSAFTNQKAANNAVQYTFGCQTYASGLFVKQLADGIMGMAAHDKSLHHILYEEKKLPNREYSLCFGYSLEVTKQGVYAGMMTLGGSNSELHDHEMVYARDFKDHGWYTVYLRKIYLCHGDMEIDDYDFTYHNPLELDFDHQVVNAGPGTIIDSGTTDMYLPKDVYASFTKRWYELVGQKYSEETFYATEEEIKKLPAIVLQLSGMKEYNTGKTWGTAHKIDKENPTDIIITMPPSFYIEQDWDDEDNPPMKRSDGRSAWISRLYFHDDSGVILGASAIRGYDVHFDVDNHRVGFARSDCNYQKRVLNNPDFRDTITTAYPVKAPGLTQSKESKGLFSKIGSLWNKGDNQGGNSNVDDDLYMAMSDKGDASNECKLSKLQIFAPCWESVSAELCNKIDKSTTLVGLETYRADILNPQPMVEYYGQCENTGYDYSDDVSLVQCFNQQYCDLVFTCTTNCDAVLSKGKNVPKSDVPTQRINFQGPIEQPQLAIKSMLSTSKQHIANIGYYGVTLLLLGGILAIALSVFNQEGSMLSKYTKNLYKKKGQYSRLATDEKYVDYESDDDDGDCEMKSLIQSDSYNKKSKKNQKKKKKEEKGEELSLFDEVLEENKNYFGEYVDDEDIKGESDEEDEEFIPLGK